MDLDLKGSKDELKREKNYKKCLINIGTFLAINEITSENLLELISETDSYGYRLKRNIFGQSVLADYENRMQRIFKGDYIVSIDHRLIVMRPTL